MIHVGFDEITEREIFCVAASTFSELPSLFTVSSKRFVALLVADTTQTSVAILSRFAESLLASGCVYFCAWGPGCERTHDIMDECSLDIDPVIMTTWHADESLDEALYFFLRNTWPDEGYSEDGSAVAITVGSAEWAAQVERRLRDRDSLTEDVLAEA
jgi:hypothetical protein